jgi:hypothetical protein
VHLSELENAIRLPQARAVSAEKRARSLGCLCALPVAALIQLAAKSTAMPLDHRQSWNLTKIRLTYKTKIPTSSWSILGGQRDHNYSDACIFFVYSK